MRNYASRVPTQIMTSHDKSDGRPSGPHRLTASALPQSLHFSAQDRRLGEEISGWIGANDLGPPAEDYVQRMADLVTWQRALHDAGYIGLSWPTEFGGRGLGLSAEAVLTEALAFSSRPELINRLALYTWGPTLLDWGTDEQKRRFLPNMLDASELWCQGFSEPNAGSDLAAVRTTALPDGDELVVTGQKVWTSRAELSKWNGLLVRTNPEAAGRNGLSVLIVDMESPGITIRPLFQILHEPRFSEVFLNEVRVPVANVLGDVNGGWGVAMAAMQYERGLVVLERQVRLRRRLEDLTDELRAAGRRADAADRIGRVAAKLDVLQAHAYRTLGAQVAGELAPGATSVDKLFLAEVYQEVFAVAYDLLGPEMVSTKEWADDLLDSRSVSIYSGTSEIQRNIISRQLLGLR